jgi:hypothetical protein
MNPAEQEPNSAHCQDPVNCNQCCVDGKITSPPNTSSSIGPAPNGHCELCGSDGRGAPRRGTGIFFLFGHFWIFDLREKVAAKKREG